MIERGAKESSSTTMTDSIAVSLPDHFKMTPGTHLLPWVMNVEGEDQSVEGPVRRAGWDHVARRPVVRESTPESANLPEGPAGLGALFTAADCAASWSSGFGEHIPNQEPAGAVEPVRGLLLREPAPSRIEVIASTSAMPAG